MSPIACVLGRRACSHQTQTACRPVCHGVQQLHKRRWCATGTTYIGATAFWVGPHDKFAHAIQGSKCANHHRQCKTLCTWLLHGNRRGCAAGIPVSCHRCFASSPDSILGCPCHHPTKVQPRQEAVMPWCEYNKQQGCIGMQTKRTGWVGGTGGGRGPPPPPLTGRILRATFIRLAANAFLANLNAMVS